MSIAMSNKEIYEANLPARIFTPEEADVFFRAENELRGSGFDVFSEGGRKALTDLLWGFYNTNRKVPVTLQGVYDLIEKNKASLPSVSPAKRDWYLASQENPALMAAVTDWLNTLGKPNELANSPADAGYTNAVQVARAHADRPLDAASFDLTAQRLTNRPGNKLSWVPLPKIADARQYKAEDVKGNTRTNWTAKDYVAENRRLAEAEAKKAQPTPEQVLTGNDAFYKHTVEQTYLQFGDHAENEAIRSLHKNLVAQGASLKTQYETLSAEVSFYKKRAQVISRSLR